MKKLLILGASGLIGKAIIDECKDAFDVYGTFFSTTTKLPNDKQFRLGLQQHEKLKEIIRTVEPDFVVSCLRGEFEQQLDFHNQLALELKDRTCNLYYFSTANVFDGDFSRHHTETDMPIAESDYGNFKIKCENILKQIMGDHVIIIRIPAIWGKDSPRMNLIKKSIENNETINAYSNLECNNLLDAQLSRQLRVIIEKALKGIFHLGSADMMTQERFFEQLIYSLSSKNNRLESKLYNEKKDIFYFGLRSNRNEIASLLRATNEDIISQLID